MFQDTLAGPDNVGNDIMLTLARKHMLGDPRQTQGEMLNNKKKFFTFKCELIAEQR